MKVSRRAFLESSGVATVPFASVTPARSAEDPTIESRWIWYPERRTLAGTFVFFRKVFDLPGPLTGAPVAWVSGNSRYVLYVNGTFLQRGPAPCDPRSCDIDPVDLAPHLRPGRNVIAALVCHFGGGDGTWVPSGALGSAGGRGFLFEASIPSPGGTLRLLTDDSWKTMRARCWKPGSYQRWFLRALQEIFDARLYPEGWNQPQFDDSRWRAAVVSRVPAGRPNLPELPREGWHDDWKLRPRTIPLLREATVRPVRITISGWVEWNVPPDEYFECFSPDAFVEAEDNTVVVSKGSKNLFPIKLRPPERRSAVVTLDFGREVVGHLFLRMKAEPGTVVEILFVENQVPGKLVLRTPPNFGQWVRVIAREGETVFESFEYEALRLMQIQVRGSSQPVEILDAGVRERIYPYPHSPDLTTSDEAINRAVRASVDTHRITSQETLVDNVTRERQQYAGDLDHAKLASYYGFGEYRQPARMFRTFTQGQNDEGWFMDCWPAWDRCERLWQRHLHITQWGPLIDHSLGLVIATATHYLFTGDKQLIQDLYPRYVRFDQWLRSHAGPDEVLPSRGWAWNDVWIDHQGWKTEIDKHAAFNIYYVGFLREGMAKLARWLGDEKLAADATARADAVAQRIRDVYWSPLNKVFVDNLPRLKQDGEFRLHDRTLAMALLFGVFPPGGEGPALDLLARLPTQSNGPIFRDKDLDADVGFSYPLNACWRLWALSRFGRAEAVTRDIRERWANLRSVLQNGTIAENWDPRPSESSDVWCQNGAVPLYVLYQDILGIRPTAPGFAEFDVRPQLGGLDRIEGTVHTLQGDVALRCVEKAKSLSVRLNVPVGLTASLVFHTGTRLKGLPEGTKSRPGPVPGTERWQLPGATVPRTWDLTAELS